jgi:hypothetical protein
MEDTSKSNASGERQSDELSDGWTGARPHSKVPRTAKNTPEAKPADLNDLERQVSAGWDEPKG